MRVWVAYSGQDTIGVFTTPERAAAYAADYNGTTSEDADYQGFEVWQFQPRRQTYWLASATLGEGLSEPLVTVWPESVWGHAEIDLPSDVALSRRGLRLTSVIVYGRHPDGLADRALAWLDNLVNL